MRTEQFFSTVLRLIEVLIGVLVLFAVFCLIFESGFAGEQCAKFKTGFDQIYYKK
jgi:hypothetical protein